MSLRHSLAPAAVAILAVALAACSGSTATAAPTATTGPAVSAGTATAAPASDVPAGGSTPATIVDFGFQPSSVTVKAGTTVTWTNTGSASHMVTADDGSFDSGTLATGSTFTQPFMKAGTYAYHCTIHSSMTATVVVQP